MVDNQKKKLQTSKLSIDIDRSLSVLYPLTLTKNSLIKHKFPKLQEFKSPLNVVGSIPISR